MAKKLILVIDDEKEITNLLMARLTVHGFDVICTNDGESGFEQARKYSPDVILLDIVMPGCNGLQTAKLLRDNPGTADIHIIFLTGLPDESTTVHFLENGNYGVLHKPFNVSELLAMLDAKFGI